MKVIFGTRGSALALAQTHQIMASFSALHPQVQMEKRIIKTSGDRDQTSSLSQLGGWGAFTRELEKALLSKEVDVAVHSLKDLPTQQPESLTIVAVVARADGEDVLLSNEGYTLDTLPTGSIVSTSSLRREVQLRRFRPDLQIKDIRGNVQTRIDKLRRGDYDAILLARAGLSRLGLLEEKGLYTIPVTMMVPAPGQGAIAVEIRQEDQALHELLLPLNDDFTAKAVSLERRALQAFGGGCRSPLAIHALPHGEKLRYRAFVSDDTCQYFYLYEQSCEPSTVYEVGTALGKRLKKAAGQASPVQVHHSKTLAGRRILVTRPASQSAEFTRLLREQGAEVLEQPMIAIEAVKGQGRLEDIDAPWLLFTSVNAVHYFLNPDRRGETSVQLPEAVKIAAIGEATRDALRGYGLEVSFMPSKATAKVFANEFLALFQTSLPELVVIPRGDKALSELNALLEQGGVKVISPLCYETVSLSLTEADKEESRRFNPEVVCVFSPSAVAGLIANGFSEAEAASERERLYASIGPTTTEALLVHGFSPVLESAVQSATALCDTLLQYYGSHQD